MNFRTFLLSTLVLQLVFNSLLNAQSRGFNSGNMFWSNKDLGEGVVLGDLAISARPGDSGRMFLYYDPQGRNITEGIDVDYSWDVPGVIAFTAAETLEFDITIQEAPFSDRWGDFAGPAEDVMADAVTGFLTVNVVNGTGILVDQIPGNGIFEDTGVDLDTETFQIRFFDWTANDRGTTSLQIDNYLQNDDQIGPPTFSSLSIIVVPEPGSSSLVAVTFLGFFCRRKIRRIQK